MIDSTNKDDLSKIVFEGCGSISEVQRGFDMIQGIYGRKFNQKRSPAYNYLCSLVAFFQDRKLTDQERQLIIEYNKTSEYLIYQI